LTYIQIMQLLVGTDPRHITIDVEVVRTKLDGVRGRVEIGELVSSGQLVFFSEQAHDKFRETKHMDIGRTVVIGLVPGADYQPQCIAMKLAEADVRVEVLNFEEPVAQPVMVGAMLP
jgi:hypothetical protein